MLVTAMKIYLMPIDKKKEKKEITISVDKKTVISQKV